MNFTCRNFKSVQHSTRESRRYGQHKSQEGVVGQHTVGEESGKRVKAQEGSVSTIGGGGDTKTPSPGR